MRGAGSSAPSPVGKRLPVSEADPVRAVGSSGPFASDLRRPRAAAGFSQEDLSCRAGVHGTQVSLLEGCEADPERRDADQTRLRYRSHSEQSLERDRLGSDRRRFRGPHRHPESRRGSLG